MIEENKELKERNDEYMILINNLTEENDRLKKSDEKTKKAGQNISKGLQKFDNNEFCNTQITIQKYITLEAKYNFLQDKFTILKTNYENLLSKLDSQNNVIKELNKVKKIIQFIYISKI